ncbi:MAG: fumarate hydratase [Candidatus Thermoplasmatota archaeon]|jgi:fumarate hydratase subunit alpha|nr:fumarate hydratase [Candidatus Thermoplasmatota archaeon]
MDFDKIKLGVVELIKKAEVELPDDVIVALKKAYKSEEGLAKIQLKNILDNINIAKKTGRPLCQDTGVQTFFIKAGVDFPKVGYLKTVITDAVRIATEKVPLRPNTVDPFTKFNHTDNVGDYIPAITWDFTDGSDVFITAIPKGAGSENMSKLVMLRPGAGLEGIKDFVVNEIINAGGNPCPPTVIGVGIGGGADLAMKLGKTALLRPVGVRHHDKKIADFERELIKNINDTGIGPMGIGGKTTVLDVHVEKAPRHPASLPVGLVVQCWADRRATMIIHSNGSWEVK